MVQGRPPNRSKFHYVCQSCGYTSPKWQGRCPSCNEWNTLVEERLGGSRTERPTPSAEPVAITDVPTAAEPRLTSGIGELDRVLGGGLVPGSLVLIGGDPGIGKCVTGDTRILDPTSGAYLPIVEWAHQRHPVLALRGARYELSPQRVVAFHDQGVRPIVQVTTRLGRVLRCTRSHPVLTPDGWRAVGALRPGTRIAAPRALPYFGHETMNAYEVKAIAYFLSNGSAARACDVITAPPEVERDLEEIAEAFGLQLRACAKRNKTARSLRFVRPRGQRADARKSLTGALTRVHRESGMSWAEWAARAGVSYSMLYMWGRGKSVPRITQLEALAASAGVAVSALSPKAGDRADMQTSIVRFLEFVGLRFRTVASKAVPACIFCLPRDQLALFLRVLFSCDGSVYVNADGEPGVSYSTISHRLAQDVQHLLLRFGLVAKVRAKAARVNGQRYLAYEVQLLGVSEMRGFLSQIGMWGRETAKARIASMASPQFPSTYFDTVPTGIGFWKPLREVTASASFKEFSAKAGVTIHNGCHERPLRHRTVAALATTYPSPYLEMLAKSDICWDEVRTVTPAGHDRVYDLSVHSDANFVANDLIIHNSTLLLQTAREVAESNRTVLYISGEESVPQIKLRAERMGVTTPALLLLAENDLDAILRACDRVAPQVLIIDSIQTVYKPDMASAPGSVGQVRECTAELLRMAKGKSVSTLIVGHVTKEGQLAGPRVLEHIVDTVLYFEGDRHHAYRILRATKNRFGSTNEIGVFEMRPEGLHEVSNPSAAFLSERATEAPGSTVVCAMEGTRPLLVEVQALVTPTVFGLPRRTAAGVDYNRMILLLAVLEKRAGLHLSSHDVYVSVAGGVSVDEPAIDLGVAAAIASSLRDRPVNGETVAIGEVGLAGEIRAVPHVGKRVLEAARLGFRRCLVPLSTVEEAAAAEIEAVGVQHLAEALSHLVP